MQPTRAARRLASAAAAVLLLLPLLAGVPAPAKRATSSSPTTTVPLQRTAKPEDGPIIHVPIPLDVQLFHLHYHSAGATDQNGPHDFALIGSLESPSWNGLLIIGHHHLQTAAGQILRAYPGPLIFRVTASLRPPTLIQVDTSDLDAPRRVDDLLDHLRFVVRINRDLQQWQYPVRQLHSIGLPLGDAFPERTYEIVFRSTRPIPLTDVICLDVYGPDGTRLAKFYLPEF